MEKTEVIKRMSIDMDAVMLEMLESIKSESGSDWRRLWAVAMRLLQSHKAQFNYLAALRINNEISNDDLQNMLQDEKELIMAEMDAEVVVSKDILSEALRAALIVLQKAIEQVL